MNNKYAVCTLVSTENYIDGALGLYTSYEQLNLPYDFIILSPNYMQDKYKNITRKQLKFFFYKEESFNENSIMPRFVKNINKFQAFNLIDYDKVLFIDADIVLLNGYSDLNYLFNQDVDDFKCFFRVSAYADKLQLISTNLDYSTLNIYSSGQILLIKPNKKFFDKIVFMKNDFTRDEEVLDYFIYILDNKDLKKHLLKSDSHFFYMHWDRSPKYWNSYSNINWEDLIKKFSNEINSYKKIDTSCALIVFKQFIAQYLKRQ